MGDFERFIQERSGKGMVPHDLPDGWEFAADNTDTPF